VAMCISSVVMHSILTVIVAGDGDVHSVWNFSGIQVR